MAARKKKKRSAAFMERYAPTDAVIPKHLGGGKLKELVIREISSGKVLAYSLAYINPLIYSLDNGRVLGYDNEHGYPHRHDMGKTTRVPFISWEALREQFEMEWRKIATDFVNGDL